MNEHPYELTPIEYLGAEPDTGWLIVRDNLTYAELCNTSETAAQRIVWALNATRHLATDAEYQMARGGDW